MRRSWTRRIYAIVAAASVLASAAAAKADYADDENAKIADINTSGRVSNDAAMPAISGQAEQTLIIYMVGSTLEYNPNGTGGAASRDLTEILTETINNPALNVVVVAGECPLWQLTSIPGGTVSVYCVSNGMLIRDKLSEAELTEPGMLTPGSMSTIADVIQTNYPANKYSMIFWDHGGSGRYGFGLNEAGSSISVEKIKEALGTMQFEWIGFDACYMADILTAKGLSGNAKYLIASQEEESNAGWNYGFLKELNANPAMEGSVVGQHIIDYTTAAHNTYEADAPFALSCIDLAGAEGINSAYAALTNALGLQLEQNAEAVADVRKMTKEFGVNRSKKLEGKQLIDMRHLAQLYAGLVPAESAVLSDAVGAAVKYQQTNGTNVNGISAWFPYDISAGGEAAADAAGETRGFLEKFEKSAADYTEGNIKTKAGDTRSDERKYSVALSDEQKAAARGAKFWVLRKNDDGTYSKVLVQDGLKTGDDGVLSTEYDGKIASVKSSGLEYIVCPYYEDGKYYFYMSEDTGNASAKYDKDIELTVSAETGKLLKVSDMSPIASKSDNMIQDGVRLAYTVDNYRDRTAAPDEVPFGDVAQGQNIRRALTTNNLSFEVKELDKEHDYFGMFEIDNVYDMPQFYSGLIPISAKTAEERAINAREFGTGRMTATSLKVCGVGISLPEKVSSLSEFTNTLDENEHLYDNKKIYSTFNRNGQSVSAVVTRGSSDKTTDAVITGIFSADAELNKDIITNKTKITDVINKYGKAAAKEDRGSFTVYRYASKKESVLPTSRDDGTTDGTEHDYISFYAENGTGIIRAIEVNVGVKTAEGKKTSEKAADAAVDINYSEPKALGNDILSFNLSLNGELYNLPVPMNKLNGWETTEKLTVSAHNEVMTAMTKGGSTIYVLAANYGEDDAALENCICTGIRLTENSNAKLELPGGASSEVIPAIDNKEFSKIGAAENRWYVYEGSDGEYEEVMRLKKDAMFLYRSMKAYELYGETQRGKGVYPY